MTQVKMLKEKKKVGKKEAQRYNWELGLTASEMRCIRNEKGIGQLKKKVEEWIKSKGV